MGIDLDDKLRETATKVAVTTNEFGDTVYGATTSVNCLYRDITIQERNANQQLVNIDGLLWFGADEDVERGDLYYLATEGYLRIERITKAKRLLTDGSLQFIKCEVTRQRQVS